MSMTRDLTTRTDPMFRLNASLKTENVTEFASTNLLFSMYVFVMFHNWIHPDPWLIVFTTLSPKTMSQKRFVLEVIIFFVFLV